MVSKSSGQIQENGESKAATTESVKLNSETGTQQQQWEQQQQQQQRQQLQQQQQQ